MSLTPIEWTDETWNPVTGCSKVSPGCAHCYAEGIAKRLWPTTYPPVACATDDPRAAVRDAKRIELLGATGVPGLRFREFTDVQTHDDRLDQPLHWKKPRKVFVNSMSDLFHEDVPDAFIDRVFAVMALASKHTFQVLTKRAERMRAYLADPDRQRQVMWARTEFQQHVEAYWSKAELLTAYAKTDAEWQAVYRAWPLPNVWIGPSIENQAMADRRFPIACELGEAGWHVMVSMEPLLGPVTIPARFLALGRRAWVIFGFESGNGARQGDVAWIRSGIAQCAPAGVWRFVKQLGAQPIDRNDAGFEGDTPTSWPMDTDTDDLTNGYRFDFQGDPVRVHLRDRKGATPEEWPADLRVRDFPKAETGGQP